jgi:hypothetical protein
MTSTNAYSSTGGNYAGPGGTVTQGASYSSVTSENIDGTSGGTATVQIETDDNGQVNDQTITKSIPPGGSIEIEVATSSGSSGHSGGVGSSIHAATVISTGSSSASLKSLQRAVHTLLTTAAATSASTSITIETSATTSPNFAQIGFGAQIMLFFKQLFSVFGF